VSGDRILRAVVVNKYVCTDCGYIEEWVNDREDLMRLKEQCVREAGLPPRP
jgi:hypothetical protein